jgi:hypothetical protein
MANNCDFALSSCAFSGSYKRAAKIASQLTAGSQRLLFVLCSSSCFPPFINYVESVSFSAFLTISICSFFLFFFSSVLNLFFVFLLLSLVSRDVCCERPRGLYLHESIPALWGMQEEWIRSLCWTRRCVNKIFNMNSLRLFLQDCFFDEMQSVSVLMVANYQLVSSVFIRRSERSLHDSICMRRFDPFHTQCDSAPYALPLNRGRPLLRTGPHPHVLLH